MNRMRVGVGWPVVAALVLVATLIVSTWIGSYTEPIIPPDQQHLVLPADVPHVTPGWAIPLAVGLGLTGATLAFLVYRRSPR